ncbi:growth hormone secretagogue receptor type 1-like [Hemiscyllium ocellatum]|uniref:growth hormone secretagogue receptor type 1-like n=1 Tax=Hemiscyllium ocellatum TaxID=170820 RepID=UPI0029675793|nr:growth hormone secretagogue receptor type 1-like [Hemiscyllium ocellatum]
MENISHNDNYTLPPHFRCDSQSCPLFPVSILVPVTTVCIVLFILGVTGNTLTILVVRRYKDMKTTTNLYLSSMAMSDLLIFLCLPFDLYRLWKYKPWLLGDFLCRFYHYINEGCTFATILHITALSIERYLAICFPLKAKVFITKRRVRSVIALLWSLALLSAVPFFLLVGVEYEMCGHTEYAVSSGLLNIMIWVSTIYFFFPMFCLTFLYGFIGRKLWKSKDEIGGPTAANRELHHRQTVKILAVVVLAFAICWLPFHIGRNLFSSSSVSGGVDMYVLSQYFNIVSLLLFYLSACINPILYNAMSKKYRMAARKLLFSRQARPWSTFSTRDIRDDTSAWTGTSTSV